MATARIVFKNSCVADVTASRVSEEKKRLLRVFDGEHMYSSDYQTQKAVVSNKAGTGAPGLASEDISLDRCDTLNNEIRAFLQCVRDKTQPLVSGREGRRALALAGMITETIKKGIAGFVPV
jgi:predicted dehydrogenase